MGGGASGVGGFSGGGGGEGGNGGERGSKHCMRPSENCQLEYSAGQLSTKRRVRQLGTGRRATHQMWLPVGFRDKQRAATRGPYQTRVLGFGKGLSLAVIHQCLSEVPHVPSGPQQLLRGQTKLVPGPQACCSSGTDASCTSKHCSA